MRMVLCTLAVLSGCGQLDDVGAVHRMEKVLAARVEARLGVKVSAVTCPRDVSLEDGVRVTCEAKLADAPVRVPLTVHWHSDPDRALMVLPASWKLASALRKQLAAKYRTTVRSVLCPAEITSKRGAVVACAAKVAHGNVPLTVEVTFTDDVGGYRWRDKGVVQVRKLEKLVADALRARGRPGVVSCPGRVRASQPGTAFRCPIRYRDGKKGEVTARVKNWEGDIDFDVE